MKCFDNDSGCLTEEALDALILGRLTEEERFDCAEHLSFCDECLDRYAERLEKVPLSEAGELFAMQILGEIRRREAKNAAGRYTAAAAAFVMASGMWSFGVFDTILDTTRGLSEIELRPQAETEDKDVFGRIDEFITSVISKSADKNIFADDKE